MQLDQRILRHSRGLVQTVDILGDHGQDRAPAHELRHREVAAVRRRPRHVPVDLELAPPRLAARLLGREKGPEVYGRGA